MTLGLGILGWIIIGGIAGWIASMIKGKNAQMGVFANIGAGVAGGLLGGFILYLLNVDVAGAGIFFSFLTCLVGAVIVLSIINMVRK